jgi:myo-inositol 2-dehydrogenase / D-chiro-inositol 1-dehydrogenase
LRTPERLRIGIIGCGRVTRLRHVPALARLPQAEIAGLADVDSSQVGELARQTGARAYPDHDALIADPEIDVVAVCVPAVHHAEVAVAALEGGKQVFLEKPVALRLMDGQRIAAAGARAKGQLIVGFNLRWHRLVKAACELVGAGAVGKVDAITTRFTSPIGNSDVFAAWRRKRMLGGGVINEIGPHHFDLWRQLAREEVVEVFAASRSVDGDDDSAVVSARTESGALVSSFFSQSTAEANEFEISGDQGRLRASLYRFDSLELTPRGIPIGDLRHRLRGLVTMLRQLPAGLSASRRGGDYADSYRREWQHVVDVVRRGSAVECTIDDGLRALDIMLAASASAASGRAIPIVRGSARIAEA